MSNLLFAQTRLPFSAARLEVSQIRNQASESVPVFSFSFAFYGAAVIVSLGGVHSSAWAKLHGR